MNWLGQESELRCYQRKVCKLLARQALTRSEEHFATGTKPSYLIRQFYTVHARHCHVCEQELGRDRGGCSQCIQRINK